MNVCKASGSKQAIFYNKLEKSADQSALAEFLKNIPSHRAKVFEPKLNSTSLFNHKHWSYYIIDENQLRSANGFHDRFRFVPVLELHRTIPLLKILTE
jgi:hypothetical protein